MGGFVKEIESEGFPKSNHYLKWSSRLNELTNIAVYADPQGGIVKITENISGPRADLTSAIYKKLKKL